MNFGFDMPGACSAATFGLHRAHDCLAGGSASQVLAVNPELVTPQVNYRDRDSRFIFGDVATAVVLERADTCTAENAYTVLGTKAVTRFSRHIRSNFGHLSRATDADPYGWDKLFHQAGRQVFEEVGPIPTRHLADHLADFAIQPADLPVIRARNNRREREGGTITGPSPSEGWTGPRAGLKNSCAPDRWRRRNPRR